jgi:hypothetical protein
MLDLVQLEGLIVEPHGYSRVIDDKSGKGVVCGASTTPQGRQKK